MRKFPLLLIGGLLGLITPLPALSGEVPEAIRVSPRDPRYFETVSGRTWIPIGLNLVHPPEGLASDEASLIAFEKWINALADNGGDYIRLWAGHRFFQTETRAGNFEKAPLDNLERVIAHAGRRGVRVKLTLEHFRHLTPTPKWNSRPAYQIANGGPLGEVAEFFDTRAGHRLFLRRLDAYADRLRDRPELFLWELWNEVEAVHGGDWDTWTRVMLPEMQRRVPGRLVTQSLGSFDREDSHRAYDAVLRLPSNDVAQVHRYLDLGAELPVCHGPIDVLAADAVEESRRRTQTKPVFLAESGGVEPRHDGAWKLLQRDSSGTVLHDVLFSAFFSGAAGPGQTWWWGSYVAHHDLWWHFARFRHAVRDIDFAGENIAVSRFERTGMRVYALRGDRVTLLWLRDARSDWRTELRDGVPAKPVAAFFLPLGDLSPRTSAGLRAVLYDPWTNQETPAAIVESPVPAVHVPAFTRSAVLRLSSDNP